MNHTEGSVTPGQNIEQLLHRGVAEVIIKEELRQLLSSGQRLRLKEGFDPSAPDIHLGHMVALRKLHQLQELGHQVVLIVGDWTARIGDPTGVSVTRPMLSEEQVRANAETYMQQFFKIVDRDKTEVRWQSEWFGSFRLSDVIKLTSKFTIAQFLARDDFNKRYREGRPITLTEFIYPLLQAYDSVAIKADVEFGGTDQKFNLLVGRELQSSVGQPPQQIFTVPLLVGTDGSQKMSKSLGNYIGVAEAPGEIFGKVMSVPDSLLMHYFELLTDVPDTELDEFKKSLETESINPMELKKRLGREVISQLFDDKTAINAEKQFVKVIQKREQPQQIPEIRVKRELLKNISRGALPIEVGKVDHDGLHPEWYLVSIPHLLLETGLVKSLSEAKRLIQQGAVDVDDNTIDDFECRIKLDGSSVIKVGKRRWLKLVSDY